MIPLDIRGPAGRTGPRRAVDAALCEYDRDGAGEAWGILIREASRIEPSEFGRAPAPTFPRAAGLRDPEKRVPIRSVTR